MLSASADSVKKNSLSKAARSSPCAVEWSNTTQAKKARECDLDTGFYASVNTVGVFFN